MKVPNIEKFNFVVLSTETRDSCEREMLESTYGLWHDVWSEALRELEGEVELSSDDFTRHASIGALFHDGKPIGSVSFTPVDLTREMWRRDSYFKAWPRDLLLALADRYPGRELLIGCYFTLAREWRRSSGGFCAKRLLMALANEYFLSTNCAAMLGTMRSGKGMHEICYEIGASPLMRDRELHGVKVDLVAFDRDEVISHSAKAPYGVEADWIFSRTAPRIDRSKLIQLKKSA